MPKILDNLKQRSKDKATALYYVGEGAVCEPCSYEQLVAGIEQAKAGLLALGVERGDRILLLIPNGPDYIHILFGAFIAGIVPSTVYDYGQNDADKAAQDELKSAVNTVRPTLIIAHAGYDFDDLEITTADQILEAGRHATVGSSEWTPSDGNDPAYIQFTSGSSGQPKGLALTWGAIETNIAAICASSPIGEADHLFSWLPTYHDMGLFGAVMCPLYSGGLLTLMDTKMFIANPMNWFRVLESQKATIAVGPPSALKVAIVLSQRRRGDFHLPHLKQMICGAEPLSGDFVRLVEEGLRPYGVASEVLRPVYGMAEVTLAISFPPIGRSPIIDRIDHNVFGQAGIAKPVKSRDADIQEWVACGQAIGDIEIEIRNAEGAILPDRHVGQIYIKTASLYSAMVDDGYLTPREGDWLNTGDMGYLADEDIFVTGRTKDLVIRAGRNISPSRVEELAEQDARIRRAAAFGIFDNDRMTERLIVVVETRSRDRSTAEKRDDLKLSIRNSLGSAGFIVDDIVLTDKNALPLTTSGKLRRSASRAIYQKNKFS